MIKIGILREEKVKTDKRVPFSPEQSGWEIVKLLERGSAFYAPGSAAAIMAESVLNDRKRLIPASVYLDGEYGLKDIFIGVPIILGANGTEKIIQLELTEEELSSLQGSANFYKSQLTDILGY